MVDLIHQLKSEARVLHRQARERGPEALRRVSLLKEFRDTGDAAIAENILRRHCLAVLAREIGFDGWPHALAVLSGERWDDFGTILYPPRGAAYWNIWSASYAEAKSLREQTGGYLLAYRKHYFIVETYFIDAIVVDSVAFPINRSELSELRGAAAGSGRLRAVNGPAKIDTRRGPSWACACSSSARWIRSSPAPRPGSA
jgi:hypothetical protein